MRTKLGAVTAFVALTTALAACGGGPPSSSDASAQDQDSGNGKALQDVYAELEGLEGSERQRKLEELAKQEDKTMTWYTTTPLEDSRPMAEGFTDKYGIDVEIYRASSADLLRRLLQEAKANHAAADVVTNNGEEMQILSGKNLLAPLETPIRQNIAEGARYDTWLGIYLNVPAAAWNTDGLSESEYPTSWEQLLTEYNGDLAMEAKAWDWFATLVEEHFMKEKGMSQQEAVDLFRQGARGATVVDGNTTIAELLVAGEFDVVSSTYKNHVVELANQGAPVTWEKAVEPVVVTTNGTGIHSSNDTPATSLLFNEYLLTEGQQFLVDVHRTPANTEYGGIPKQYDTLLVDPDKMVAQREKWETLYNEVIRESGSEIVEEEG